MNPSFSELLVSRIKRGLPTVVVGEMPELPKNIAVVRLRCDTPSTLGPLERAKEMIEHLLEDDLRFGAKDHGASRALSTETASMPRDERLLTTFNQLAARLPGHVVLVLDQIDSSDEETHRALARLLRRRVDAKELDARRPQALLLPLVLLTSGEPRGSFEEVVTALDEMSSQVFESLSDSKAARGSRPLESPTVHAAPPASVEEPEPLTLRIEELPIDVRRVLRASAVVGTPVFDSALVARILEMSPDHALETLQQAADIGFPLRDLGGGVFEMPQDLAKILVESVMPSLRQRWHDAAGRILSGTERRMNAPTRRMRPAPVSEVHLADEAKPADVPPPPASREELIERPITTHEPPARRPDPLRAAGHFDEAGKTALALEQRLDAVAILARSGDVQRANAELRRVLEVLPSVLGVGVSTLSARAKMELARLRWLGVGVEPTFTLSGALEAAIEARTELGASATSPLATDLATIIAGISYDLGDGASLERALAILDETVASLLQRGANAEAASLLNDQAAIRLRMGQPNRTIELLQRSLELSMRRLERRPSDTVAQADLAETRHILARLPLHARVENGPGGLSLVTALEHARVAEEIFTALGRRRDLTRVMETIARLEAKRGERDTARRFFNVAMKLADEMGDITGLARITAGLAELLASEGSPRAALAMLSSSIELNRSKGSPIGLAFDEQLLHAIERATRDRGQPIDQELADELRSTRDRLVRAIEESSSAFA